MDPSEPLPDVTPLPMMQGDVVAIESSVVAVDQNVTLPPAVQVLVPTAMPSQPLINK
jgi:hypothetical protein